MATIVPRRLGDKLTFFKTHVAKFAENAAEIGLSPEEVAELEAKVEAAEAARREQAAAQLEAESATARFNQAMDALGGFGATLILKVRAKAESTDNPAVYTLASLPVPAKPSPIAPPGMPTYFRSSIDGIGRVTIRWDCDNPKGSTGTMYQVRRQLNYDQPFAPIGVAGKKRFVDATIPKGATSIAYEVQAVRSTAVGPVAQFNVSFGSNGHKPLPGYLPTGASRQFAA